MGTSLGQSLLSDQEIASINSWLNSPDALEPQNLLPRATLQLFQQSGVSLDFVENARGGDQASALSTRAVQCSREKQLQYCENGEALRAWMEEDSSNLSPYLLLAKQSLQNDDEAGGLFYLQRGLEADRVDAYYFYRFMAVREVLQGIGFRPGRRNFITELILLSSLQEIYGSLLSICTARVEQSEQWAQACLRLADKLETGETFYANVIGAAIRRDVVPLVSSDETEILAAQEHRAGYDRIRQQAQRSLDWWTNPEGRPESWYVNALEAGELEALRRALAAATD